MLITLRRELRAKGQFWYAYKKVNYKLHKVYVGKSQELSTETLSNAVVAMREKISGKPQTTPSIEPTPIPAPVLLADYCSTCPLVQGCLSLVRRCSI